MIFTQKHHYDLLINTHILTQNDQKCSYCVLPLDGSKIKTDATYTSKDKFTDLKSEDLQRQV